MMNGDKIKIKQMTKLQLSQVLKPLGYARHAVGNCANHISWLCQ